MNALLRADGGGVSTSICNRSVSGFPSDDLSLVAARGGFETTRLISARKKGNHMTDGSQIKVLVLQYPKLELVEQDIVPGLEGLYQAIGCNLVDVIRGSETHDAPFGWACYVDDEGLLTSKPIMAVVEGRPVAGNLVFVGTSAEGDDQSLSASEMLDIHARVRLLTRPVEDYDPDLMMEHLQKLLYES